MLRVDRFSEHAQFCAHALETACRKKIKVNDGKFHNMLVVAVRVLITIA